MEDQQSDPDDVTAARPDGPSTTLPTGGDVNALGNRRRRRPLDEAPRGKRQRRSRATTAATSVADHADDVGEETVAGTDSVAAAIIDGGETDSAAKRFHRWHTILVAAAAAIFVASVTFAGASLHTYLADRAAASTRTEVARTAVAAVTTLWTYTPETIDTLADRATQYLSGDFNAEYRRFLDAAAAPNKQAQVTDSTEVVGVGVESVNGPDAVAIVFTNTTATSPLTKNVPSLKYVGYRLAMHLDGSRWLVTRMTTVSFTDLTPQL
ncbi:mammalian cell entry protein [Mycobacterium hodleri]|uniref:Mammalian cell entry protein n=1 Tax=Mycolicibacterium hodleri TaxID=49897 RepID=A0A544VWF3_9MYCO|nr:mammalian cell entry protein [Mycolicibacterium hodleri]TQR84322.1 mammalian cell entry protein [Mycolicibacterium hodleri]